MDKLIAHPRENWPPAKRSFVSIRSNESFIDGYDKLQEKATVLSEETDKILLCTVHKNPENGSFCHFLSSQELEKDCKYCCHFSAGNVQSSLPKLDRIKCGYRNMFHPEIAFSMEETSGVSRSYIAIAMADVHTSNVA